MSKAISGYLDRVAEQLRVDYGWDVEPLDIKTANEPETHVFIRLSVTNAEPVDGMNLSGDGLWARLGTVARVDWKVQDRSTQQLAHPTDIAATLLAWTNRRVVDGAGLLQAGRMDRILEPDTYREPDPTRVGFLVTFTGDVWIEPELDGRSPEARSPLDPPEVGTPTMVDFEVNP